MARIRGRTREQTRELSLEAATRVFAEFGFDGTTLSKVAAMAGVTPATLCHHFGSKQKLYDAVVDRLYGDIMGLAPRVREADSFEGVVHEVFGFLSERRNTLRLLMRNIIDSGGVTPRVRETHMGPLIDVTSRILAARFGADPIWARRTVVVLTHLLMRFITNHEQDNRTALGLSPDDDLRVELEGIVVSVGRHLLGQPAG